MTLSELLERLRAGDQRAVARLISWVEDGDRDQLREAAEALNPAAGRAQVIGLTGSPGVGKSTLAGALVAAYRAQGLTVGVLAVDPSSPFTGGALLGDRVRMQRHALDEGVYIRSMATRGHLGGLAWATPQAVRVLDAAGCDVVLVETVGVGQAEVEVAGLADTTLVALAPGFGDAVQVAKAGILEVADVFVVNKADRDGAEVVARDLRQMLHLGAATPWQVPVLLTVAERGDGVPQLVEAIAAHRAHLASSGELERRRRHRAAREIEEVALASLRTELGELGHGEALDTLAEQVAAGKLGPYSAADQLLAGVRGAQRLSAAARRPASAGERTSGPTTTAASASRGTSSNPGPPSRSNTSAGTSLTAVATTRVGSRAASSRVPAAFSSAAGPIASAPTTPATGAGGPPWPRARRTRSTRELWETVATAPGVAARRSRSQPVAVATAASASAWSWPRRAARAAGGSGPRAALARCQMGAMAGWPASRTATACSSRGGSAATSSRPSTAVAATSMAPPWRSPAAARTAAGRRRGPIGRDRLRRAAVWRPPAPQPRSP